MYGDQRSLQQEYERVKSEQEKKERVEKEKRESEMSGKKKCGSEKKEIVAKKENHESVDRKKKNVSFYAKESDIKRALSTNRPMIVVVYKEACLSTNDFPSFLPSVAISLLQEFEDVFLEGVLCVLDVLRKEKLLHGKYCFSWLCG